MKPIGDNMSVIRQRVGYPDWSSLFTPTKALLTHAPVRGYKTALSRFRVPVSSAKTVPSTLVGVILANRAMIGNVAKAV